jgi:transposase-like protein
MKEKRKLRFYSKETKLLAVKMYLEQGKSQGQITEELGLPRKKLVELWVHQYRQEGEMAFSKPIGRPLKSTQSQEEYIARLEMENALLKKYHTELRNLTLARRDIGSSNITEEDTP